MRVAVTAGCQSGDRQKTCASPNCRRDRTGLWI